MIKSNILAIKADADELYAIFLLKKNVWHDIIKIILGYPSIAMPEILKEWKVAIMLVEQEYESTEECHDYKTSTRTMYSWQEQPIDIGKSNKNFKDRKPKCFNCNKYRHIAKECPVKKKEQETIICFKCDKEGHISRDCKGKQTMKKRKVQERTDDQDKKSEQGFSKDLE